MNRYASLRETLGWSQEQMAAYLGIHQSTVARIEDGRPASGSVERLADRLASLSDAGAVNRGDGVNDVLRLAISHIAVEAVHDDLARNSEAGAAA